MRDAALISVGYDTLCRSSELALMDVDHVRFEKDGTATLFIPRSKSDVAGDGRIAYLSPELPLFFPSGLTPLGFEAAHSSEPFTLIALTMELLQHPQSGGLSNARPDGPV